MTQVLDSLATQCRLHILSNYRVEMDIGVYAQEYGRKQPVVFTVEVWTELPDVRTTNGNDCWDYAVIAPMIDEISRSTKLRLQEDLHEALFSKLFADKRVRACRILTQKTAVYENGACAGVQTFRFNPCR